MPLLEDIIPVFETSPTPLILLYPDTPDFTIAYANDAFLDYANTVSSIITGKGFLDTFFQPNNEEASFRMNVIKSSLAQVLELKKTHRILLQWH